MSEYRMHSDGRVLSESDYKALHPCVSFALDFEPTDADRVAAPAPPATTIYERAIPGDVVNILGQWVRSWAIVPALPPESVPMLNARLALIEAGHMASVATHLAAMSGTEGERARAYFEFAQNVRRDHEVVEALRLALSMTHEEIDALFILAASYG